MGPSFGSRFSDHLLDIPYAHDSRHIHTVLVVDDNEKTCALLAQVIDKKLGHNVLFAHSGLHAMGILKRAPIDLVLLDLLLPGMDGYKILTKIRADRSLEHIPVLVLTGVDDSQSATRCLKMGADDYIVKPCDFTILSAKVASCLEKKRLQDGRLELAQQLEQTNSKLLAKVSEVDKEIKERKAAEEALRESETRFKALADASFEGIAVHQNGRILDVNTQFAKMFRLDSRLVHGAPVVSLVDQEYTQALKKELDEDKDLWVLEVTCHNGKMDVEIRGRSIPNKGIMVSVLAVRDITERKRTERQLVEALNEAGRATELKDTFISLLAHNLREPLGSIIGMLNAITELEMEAPMRDNMLARCLDNSNALLQMIERLLDLSRLKKGKIDPKISSVNCWSVAEELIDRLSDSANSKNITLKNSIPNGWNINTDHGLLAEVLHNLVSNAIKYSKPKEEVEITIVMRHGPTIAVKDRGMGITGDLKDILFQADPKCRRQGTAGEKGLGIGLSLSLEIMNALGGSLEFESREGGGTEFYVRLPNRSKRILYFGESHHSIVEVKREMVQGGNEVSIALNSREAMALVHSIRPHILMTGSGADNSDDMAFILSTLEALVDEGCCPALVFLVDETAPSTPTPAPTGRVTIHKISKAGPFNEKLSRIIDRNADADITTV